MVLCINCESLPLIILLIVVRHDYFSNILVIYTQITHCRELLSARQIKKAYNHIVLKLIQPTVETVGNVEKILSITITNGFNRWNFKSAICRVPEIIVYPAPLSKFLQPQYNFDKG